MNTIVIFAAVAILGFAAGRVKSMSFFRRPAPGKTWVLVPDDKLPEILYLLDETSAFSSTVDRLFLSKKS